MIITSTQSVLKKILQAVKPIEDINSKLDNLTKEMGDMKTKVESQGNDISTVKKDLQDQKKLADKLKTRLDNFGKKQEQFTILEKSLISQNKHLPSEIVKLEECSRRNNLLFQGLEERDREDCEWLVQNFLATNLSANEPGREWLMSKAHRVGKN